MTVDTPTVRSPCISVCKLDKHGVCEGCYRTVDEIRQWFGLDNEARAKILEEVEKRKPKKWYK
jgi:predicted Fe-S protein YdhL (DUF1289 family)